MQPERETGNFANNTEKMNLRSYTFSLIQREEYEQAMKILNIIPSNDEHWVSCFKFRIHRLSRKNEINSLKTYKLLMDSFETAPEFGCLFCFQELIFLMDKIKGKQRQINTLARSIKPSTSKMQAEIETKIHKIMKVHSKFTNPPQIQNLLFWCEKVGVQCRKWAFYANPQNPSCRTTIAKEKILPGQVILRYPFEHLITLEKIKLNQMINSLLNKDKRINLTSLFSMFLLWNIHLGELSEFKSYIDALPKNMENFPLMFSPQLLEELKQTNLYYQIEELRSQIQKQVTFIKESLNQPFRYTYQEFTWAYLIVRSRSFRITKEETSVSALVPIADMMNHQNYETTRWGLEDGQFIVKNMGYGINKGEQILTNYGNKSNENLLMIYGFLIPDNQHNVVQLQYQYMDKLIMIELPANLKCRKFQKTRRSCLIHSLNLEEKGIIKWELKFLNMIRDCVEKYMAECCTTIEKDEYLLRKIPEKQLNLRNCIQYRLELKKIMRFYHTLSKDFIKYFSSNEESVLYNFDYRPYISLLEKQGLINSF